jgi:hypothetical protein
MDKPLDLFEEIYSGEVINLLNIRNSSSFVESKILMHPETWKMFVSHDQWTALEQAMYDIDMNFDYEE